MPKANHKRTICLDFDGVIHSYVSGWSGATNITDDPVPGAFQFISDLQQAGWQVAVLSARSHEEGGIDAMKQWMTISAGVEISKETGIYNGWEHASVFDWKEEVGDKIPLIYWLFPELDKESRLDGRVGPFSMDHAIKKAARKFVNKIDFPTHKPPAILYIDDRAFCFQGTWPSMDFIQNFKPWNKV